jgi:hypothetical protein
MPAENMPAQRVTINEIAQFTAWARRLSAAGPDATDEAELAAFHITKAQLFARIENQYTNTTALDTAPNTAQPHSHPDSDSVRASDD